MKALLSVVLFTLSAGMGHAVAASDGPGSGNGDDGTLMLSKIQSAKGLNEFETLLYAYERGTVPPRPVGDGVTKWLLGIQYSYGIINNTYTLQGVRLSGNRYDKLSIIALGVISRGPLLAPILQLCFSNYGCTSGVKNEVIVENNEMSRGDFLENIKLRVYNGLLLIKEIPDTNGKCESNTATPVNGVCSISYKELIK